MRHSFLLIATWTVFFVLCPLICLNSASSTEPFGAEDFGAQDNIPLIPEPLVFDLVRGLGAHKGEFEINTLAEFPLNSSAGKMTGHDPFSGAPHTEDTRGIDWAPEVEYAIADGVALEFELPFEDSHLEAYKFAAQGTFGTAFCNQFIHGAQTIVEPDADFEDWELTFLYLAGVKFDEVWSCLGMFGFRTEVGDEEVDERTEKLFNFTLFANVAEDITLGIESNLATTLGSESSLLIIPQMNYEVTDHCEIQSGLGIGFLETETLPIFALRVIYSR